MDQIYMQAVQSMTGHGGWPMTVFLTPDGVPFYGGTYFPPTDRHGMPAFPRLLRGRGGGLSVAARRGGGVRASARRADGPERAPATVGEPAHRGDPVRRLSGRVPASSTSARAASGQAPKFPQPMNWEFMLRFWKRSGNARALEMARLTLTRMARGGMYDQLGGGFHRYSVDGRWLVPHFEKMLYDNGQLASLYLHAWLATGDPEYRRVTEETLDYLLREMSASGGRLLLGPGRRLRGRGGQVLRLVAGRRSARRCRTPRWPRAFSPTGASPTGPTSRGTASCYVPRAPEEVAHAARTVTGPARRADRRGRARFSTRGGSSAFTRAWTTRCSRHGTAWRWPPSRRRAGRSVAPTTPPRP